MARPQLENGHTQIANELLDAFCRTFPGGANAQVLLAIIRKTYGWKKKQDSVSISQLEELTGLSHRSVIYCLQNLEAKKMITVERQRGRGHVNQINMVAVQKNYELWVVQRKGAQYEKQLQKQREKYQKKVVQRNEKRGQFFAPTKETIQKKLYKRNHGEFDNVLFTDKEYQKLIDKFGDAGAKERIEALSLYIESKGVKYKSHYATVLAWELKNKGGNRGEVGRHSAGSQRRIPEAGQYTQPRDIRHTERPGDN